MLKVFLSRFAAANEGASAVEFGLLTALVVLPLTLGTYDFGTALYHWLQVGNAARTGAQYINVNGYNSTYTTAGNSCLSGTKSFTCAVQSSTSLGSNVTVSAGAAYCGCQNGTSYSAVTFSPPCNVCSASGASNCCPAGQTPVTLTRVTASYNYQPIFTYLGFGPSNGFPLSATATALIY